MKRRCVSALARSIRRGQTAEAAEWVCAKHDTAGFITLRQPNSLQTPSETTRRFRELDGLRGVLAWIVVASHILVCVGWIGPIVGGDYFLSQVAAAAVDVFIILSGFAITRLLIVTHESGGRYVWRRICRIFPAYWAALLAGIALNAWVADNLRQLPRSAVIEM